MIKIVVSAATTVAVFSTNAFTWRGNVLQLKDSVQALLRQTVPPTAPFKLDTIETSLNPPQTSDVQAAKTDVKGYPLLPEASQIFPGKRQIVFCNEMKFRELMSDAQSVYSNELIRCCVDQSGCIERIGLKCRIIESRSLKNGQAMYVIESLNKIQIDGMTVKEGKSYLSSTKTQELEDEMITEADINANEMLSINLFTNLQVNLRLCRMCVALIQIRATGKDLGERHDIFLPPALIASRPGQADFPTNSPTVKIERHNNFSYHVSNMLSRFIGPDQSHLLLISDTNQRLAALSYIVKLSADEARLQVTNLLQESIDQPEMNDLMIQTVSTDEINDLSPPSDWKDLHIDSVEFEGDDEDGFQTVEGETDDGVMQ